MTQPIPAPDTQPADLIKRIRKIIVSTRALAARSIDTAQVAMNFAIGQRIVEHEQAGEERTACGRKVLAAGNWQAVSAKSNPPSIGQTVSDQLPPSQCLAIAQMPSAQFSIF